MQFLYFDQHGSFRNAGFVRDPQDIDSRSVDLELHSNLRREQELAGFPAPLLRLFSSYRRGFAS